MPPDRCSDVLAGGLSRAAPSGAGARGGCPPGRGLPAPVPGQLVGRQGTVIYVRGRIHPGTGCGWRHRPQPGHTRHTPHTHDQGPSASSHKGCARMSAAPRTHQQHYRQNLPACRDVFRSLFAARLHWLATAHACSARSPVCESWHLTLRTSSLSVRTTRGYGGAKPWLPVTLLTRRTATAFDPGHKV